MVNKKSCVGEHKRRWWHFRSFSSICLSSSASVHYFPSVRRKLIQNNCVTPESIAKLAFSTIFYPLFVLHCGIDTFWRGRSSREDPRPDPLYSVRNRLFRFTTRKWKKPRPGSDLQKRPRPSIQFERTKISMITSPLMHNSVTLKAKPPAIWSDSLLIQIKSVHSRPANIQQFATDTNQYDNSWQSGQVWTVHCWSTALDQHCSFMPVYLRLRSSLLIRIIIVHSRENCYHSVVHYWSRSVMFIQNSTA